MGMLLLTAFAGGIGGAARFAVDEALTRRSRFSFPVGTFVVNASACLIMGALVGYLFGRVGVDNLVFIIGVGLLGGYSTFSTASVEGAKLMRKSRIRAAVAHSGGMLLTSLVAAIIGLTLGGLVP